MAPTPARWRLALRVALVGGGALVASLPSGCSSDPASAVRTFSSRTSSITVSVHERFAIRLEANPSTGYTWKVSQLPAGISLVGERAERPSGAAPGVPGAQRFTFEAEQPGTTTLELAYLRPFEQGQPPAKTASFTVHVGA